jgi:hypothetical protein
MQNGADEMAARQPAAEEAAKDESFRMPVWSWLTAWAVAFVGIPVAVHTSVHGFSGLQAAIAFFLAINLMICIWEISLWHRIDDIRRWFHLPKGTEDRPRGNLYTTPISLREFWSTKLWARTWLGYAYWDDGYADPKSFGWSIDVGNGFTTLIPTLLFLVGMTFEFLPAQVLGIIGLLLFYQKFYGTCLYFFQYLYNERYKDRPLGGLIGVVGGTNGLWLVFPAFGLYASVRLILDGSYQLFCS